MIRRDERGEVPTPIAVFMYVVLVAIAAVTFVGVVKFVQVTQCSRGTCWIRTGPVKGP